MRFDPVTEEEAVASARGYLLKPGECDFEVRSAEAHRKPKDGGGVSESIKLVLDVSDADNKQAQVFDYLNPALSHKLRHFAYATGLGHEYERGGLEPEQCIGKGGRLIIRNKKDPGYDAKNDVADYVVSDRTKTTPNYQQAKGRDNGVPGPSGRRQAWETFQKMNPGKGADEIANLWRSSLFQEFGEKPQGEINDTDWVAFIKKLRTPKPAMVGRANMEFDEKEFDVDDIPI